MEFRIADTFTDSLTKLTGNEQSAVKETAFDLQLNPANPGMKFHRLERIEDKNFWSVRASRGLRVIVHRTQQSLLLCYAGSHDDSYEWARRRKLQTHPKTGAAQFVEIRETVQEVIIPRFIVVDEEAPPKPPLFANISEEDLLSYGVPPEWLGDVQNATEDTYLQVADHLPAEAAEALLQLATGGKPKAPEVVEVGGDPFEHPDAQRRFRVMRYVEELERALDLAWDKWGIFLHPAQQQTAEGDYNGPARVSGSAGTGKTTVALHRAVFLARANPETRVLLTTFSDTLANALRIKLRLMVSNEPSLGERLEVHSLDAIGRRLYQSRFGAPHLASQDLIRQLVEEAAEAVEGHQFSLHFLVAEWEQVVDAWQLETWESYRDVLRLGRRTRLPENRRSVLWSIFEIVRSRLKADNLITNADMFCQLASKLLEDVYPPFDFAVMDESQDVTVSHLRFLAALGGGRANSLFFAGDLGQRIFQLPFSWLALGVDVRGRSRTLRINYRTSHQIRMHADRLLGPELADVDGNLEERHGTVSVFNGPDPTIMALYDQRAEIEEVSRWLADRTANGLVPGEIGIFVRSPAELDRARQATEDAGLPYKLLDDKVETTSGYLSISTMHLAKGLEFRAVVVMACDDEVIPLQERIESVADDADLEEVYNTERHLLYVACTRARDHLLVTSVEPASEFLDDLRM